MRLHRQFVRHHNRVGACVALLRAKADVCLDGPKPARTRKDVDVPNRLEAQSELRAAQRATVRHLFCAWAQYQKRQQNP